MTLTNKEIYEEGYASKGVHDEFVKIFNSSKWLAHAWGNLIRHQIYEAIDAHNFKLWGAGSEYYKNEKKWADQNNAVLALKIFKDAVSMIEGDIDAGGA